ncbi:DUF4230 domain-containing protein [uncultured Ruminococcus sp.]|uniref:DUF4230 domain-containing protein n=1 Tax=uncultured Ruminococcus sp. TaxID=165186 RepID=UPI0026382C5D|nr:DUF4230 domain-containing protein [uncultured Ruminococcus sp.]
MEKKSRKQLITAKIKKYLKKIKGFLKVALPLAIGIVIGVVASPILSSSKNEDAKPTIVNIDETIKTQEENESILITVSNVKKIISPASELTSTKYYYKDADSFEDSKEFMDIKLPLTTNKVVFTYEGVINIGIDLSEVSITDIDNENQRITIRMPDVKILSHEVDMSSFEFPFEDYSIFNETQMGDYTQLIEEIKKNKEEKISSDSEIMENTRENAENVIRSFLKTAEMTKDYNIIFTN